MKKEKMNAVEHSDLETTHLQITTRSTMTRNMALLFATAIIRLPRIRVWYQLFIHWYGHYDYSALLCARTATDRTTW